MNLVREDINSVLKPKDPQKIVTELLDKGSIQDKYAVVVQLFNEDWGKLHEEFIDRGIDDEELIDSYISFWAGYNRTGSPEKVHWILSDILQDNIDKITEELIKKAIG